MSALRIHLMWVNPADCQSNKDFQLKIWLQKHAKMTFDFKENVDWVWKGREEPQASESILNIKIFVRKL